MGLLLERMKVLGHPSRGSPNLLYKNAYLKLFGFTSTFISANSSKALEFIRPKVFRERLWVEGNGLQFAATGKSI